ncbi:MAG: glutamate--tRNA ligase [Chloroflexi bacterium]|nr:glutamate--tRNA ligase [Chloroflexota bacterium]
MSDSPSRPVRTRFAPSPTGSLHIGGLRTALFNWLFARHYNGAFILRIEDTDQKRFDPSALDTLMEALRWAGLQWDEGPEVGGAYGPYVQSERVALYQQWANWLVENDKAYRCYCSSERLQQVNKDKEARKEPPGYDRHCRDLTPEQRAAYEAQGITPVIRFRMPLDGQTIVQDAIRGESVFDNANQQDAVLLKSDGFPTYHLAVVVDDHFMQISHVMRAIEWFPSFPLHVQLWQAFGWEMPIHAHLPVMLNPNGKGKMSKRNPPKDKYGNIIPVMVHDYMRAGYLPEAMVNFLANIGWNFGDEREFFMMDEAIQRFDLTRINPANSAFPVEKLDWLNGEHIRALPADELARRLRTVLVNAGFTVDDDLLRRVTPLVQIRLKTLNEIVSLAGFFFRDEFLPAPPEELIQEKMDAEKTCRALERAYEALSTLDDFSHAAQEAVLRPLTDELGLKPKQLFGTLRVAVTGQRVATPLFETNEILGKNVVLERIKMASQTLVCQP